MGPGSGLQLLESLLSAHHCVVIPGEFVHDGDGLTNLEEYLADTNPQEGDTDSDGVDDASDNHPNDSTRS